MTPNIGMDDKSRKNVGAILTRILADAYVLYTKTRNYHWNVVGPQFHELHKAFEMQHEALDDVIDEVAERARAIGQPVAGTLTEFLQHARLKEHPGQRLGSTEMITDLARDHEAIIRQLREDVQLCAGSYGDIGTSDFLTGIMKRHEKLGWMLRAYLEGQ